MDLHFISQHPPPPIQHTHTSTSRTNPSCHQLSRWLATENVFMPATFAHLNIAEQAPVINAYTTNGFIIRGNRVYGSVALLPRGMLHWRVLITAN